MGSARGSVAGEALKAIKDAGGDVNIPQDYDADLKLGRWLNTQRMAKKSGTLAAERIARLEALDVEWDLLEAAWQENYRALKAIRDSGGVVNISINYPENPRLGMWLGTQRMAKKRGTLAAERVAQLEALGIVWEPREAAWLKRYQALKAIKDAGGEVNLPQTYPANPRLGSWLNEQRMAKKKGTLAAERAALLDTLDVAWEPSKKDGG